MRAGRTGGAAGRDSAWAQFLRTMRLIALIGVAMVAGSLFYISRFGELTTAAVLATVGGVLLSVLLGCGLFAAAFFSDRSGHDDAVTRATGSGWRGDPDRDHRP